jgi:hypothetical protein
VSNPTLTQRLAGKPAQKTLTFGKGPKAVPWTMMVYGPEGVGKSSLVLDIEGHAALDIEQSQNQLDTNKNEQPITTLQDVYDAIQYFYSQDHQLKTLVIDTIDRLEALIWAHVVARAKATPGGNSINSIEDFGYGKGYQVALDEWRRLIARLDELRVARNMNVLLIGHTFVKNFKNPDGPDYDRYTLRLNEKASGFLKEWCDAVLFARFDETSTKVGEKGRERIKGVMSGDRSLYTVRTAAYDAKNRFGLPEQLPLSWRELEAAMKAGLDTKKGAQP